MEAAEETGSDPWIDTPADSVVLSGVAFPVARVREMGLIVGLWPPSFHAFGSCYRRTRTHDTVQGAMGGGGTIERVERMVQGR